MPAGFQLFNPSGRLLLDSNALYYGLVKSGPIENVPRLENFNYLNKGIRVNAIAPIAFVEGGANFVTTTRSGNTWTFYIDRLYPYPSDDFTRRGDYEGWPAGVPGSTGTVQTRIYIFDIMRPNKSRTGLEVFNSNGEVVFNSDQWPLNVEASVISPPPYGGNGLPYTKQSGWTYDTDPTAAYGYTCSRSVADYGLDPSRRWALHSPWSRGAQGYGGGDNFAAWESYAINQGRVGFCWQEDPFTAISIGSGFWPVYGVQARRPALALADVTDMPFPYQF